MIWYRDGMVWVPDPAALDDQADALRLGALEVAVESDAVVPPLRQKLELHVLIGGQRLGPFLAEAVRVGPRPAPHPGAARSLTTVSLQLADSAREALSSLLPPSARSAASASADTEGEAPLHGRLEGRVTLGVVPRLFDDQPTSPPPSVTTLGRLLCHLHQRRLSGLLTVEGTGYVKRVSFRAGVAVDVEVTPFKEDEQLGQILLGAHWISPHKLADVVRWARADKISIGTALLQGGVLDQTRLDRALAHQTYRRLRDLFDWQGAVYSFDAAGQVKVGSHPMSVPKLLHELAQELLRTALLDDLMVLVSPYNERFPRIEGDEPYLRRLIPDAKTWVVCQRIFRGDRTLRQAITASVLGRARTVRLVLYLLAARGLVLHVEPPASPTPLPPALVRERARAIGVQDAFQRLGVTYWVDPAELETARFSRLASYQHRSAARRVDPSTADRICQLIDEAWMMIGNARGRRKYRERLLGREMLLLIARVLRDERDYLRVEQRVADAQRLDRVLAEFPDQ